MKKEAHRKEPGNRVGLTYATDGQTVSHLQHLDPKQINLKILVWMKKRSSKRWTVITVSRFKHVYGRGLYAIGRDTKKYDKICLSGNTRLYAYSY